MSTVSKSKRAAVPALEALELRYMPVRDAVLFDRNPKRHDIGSIAASIARHGMRNPPIWDASLNGGEGGIVAGNGRTETLAMMEAQGQALPRGIRLNEQGHWCMPIVFGCDALSEHEAIAYAIDDNNLTMSGADLTHWDMAKLWDDEGYMNLLASIQAEGVTPITVDDDAIAALLRGLSEDKQAENNEEESAAKLAEKADSDDYIPRVKDGEIWKLGRHYVACADCTDEANIKALMDAAGVSSIDMVWADPPYGISIVATNGYVGGGEAYGLPFGGIKNETEAQRQARLSRKQGLGTVGGSKPFGSKDVRGTDGATNIVEANKYFPIAGDDSIDVAIDSAQVYLAEFGDAVQCWWGGNYYANVLPNSNCWIVWDKENTGGFADAELAWTNQKSAVRIFKHMWNGMVKASEHGQRRVHPTQKPIALAEWFFEKYGKPLMNIIDPFLGSGMSLIAAEKMNHTLIGFELSSNGCSIICDRWEQLTGGVAEKVGEI